MSKRCTAVHWFSVDPPGIGKQCVLNVGDHGMSVADPHWDDEGRWWAVVTGFRNPEPEQTILVSRQSIAPEPCECHGDPYCEGDK